MNFKWLNNTVCELYLSKAVGKNKKNTDRKQQQQQNVPNTHSKSVVRTYTNSMLHQIFGCTAVKREVNTEAPKSVNLGEEGILGKMERSIKRLLGMQT